MGNKTVDEIAQLKHPIKKSKRDRGFTLIEVLVTMAIIGLLAAIALPSFMGHIHRAKETEAKLALNTLEKDHYSFYLENSKFADQIGQLNFYKIDSNPDTPDYIETENYLYSIQGHPKLNGKLHLAFSRKKAIRSYGSVVHLKDGQLEACSLFSLDISQEHSGLAILLFILDAIENYQHYCS